jgi:hypothetical protein
MPRSVRVEISLRIPAVKDAQKNEAGYPINNADVRFVKIVELDALPAIGDRLTLSARPDQVFSATVVRVDWSDDKNMFAVACRYSERAIPRGQYLALTTDTEWAMRSLL